jgi:steroid-24-oyl-CoA synthetase
MATPDEIAKQLTAPGQMFEIEHIELNGASIKSWKNAPPSMAAILEQSRAHGAKEFIVFQDQRLTFEEHYRRVASVANHLVTRLGIEKGDRVAIAMRNYPEWCIAFWAAVSAGAIVVPLNAWWTSSELEYGLTDAGAKLVFADQQRLARLAEIDSPLPMEHVVAVRCESLPEGAIDFESLLDGATADASLPDIEILPDDDATIFYTSGTTGFPKGALGTHRNFCSVVASMGHANMTMMLRMGMSPEDLQAIQQIPQASLLTVPLFHVSGCHGMMTTMLTLGGKLVIPYKWDPQAAIDAIEQEKITIFSGVPSMAWELLTFPGVEERDLSSLLSFGYGGAPAAPELLRLINSKAPHAGVLNGWGITETSSAISSNGGEEYLKRPDSVGWPIAVCEVKVVDPAGRELAANEQGELWVRGPNVVKGYWNRSEATAESFTDGWFHTGDVGKIDEEGRIYVMDRLKDMIIRAGENVYCAEVEAVLLEHPQVNAACVFGVPHQVLGEEVAAVVEVAPDAELSEQELQQHAAASLAKFKVPSKTWFRREALPVGATGKVQKKELRAFYIDLLEKDG